MLIVLTYHRVAEPESTPMLNPRMISATPASFEKQMQYLSKNYHVVSCEEVVDAIEKKRSLPKRCVLITIDDAYCDFGEIAWPILKKLKLPVTLFVPTGFPDHPEKSFWWDRLHNAIAHTKATELNPTPIGALSLKTQEERIQNLKRLQNYVKTLSNDEAMNFVDETCRRLNGRWEKLKSVLSWDELIRLSNEGVTLGAHTQTHPIMTQISPAQVRREIVESQNDLKNQIDHALPVFCYPSGCHNDTVVDILREEKFSAAFTTLDGHNDLSSVDPIRIRRTNITRRTTLPIFRFRLTQMASYLDAWRHRKEHATVST